MPKLKVKWLSVAAPLNLAEISERLVGLKFHRGGSAGIELIDIRRDYLVARFVEEVIDTEVYTDPFGDKIVNEIRRYLSFTFNVYEGNGRFVFRVDNPPRSLKSFVGLLSDSFGLGFSISPLTIDILSFLDELRVFLAVPHCVVRKIRIGNVRIEQSTLARVEATSTNDAYADISGLWRLEGAIVEKVTIEFRKVGYAGALEIASSGVLSADDELIDELTSMCIGFFDKK
ncbi:MAG: hypothetical protein ABIG35_04510 [Pseudomonadota bacterium]